jgi:hypothetical protein
MEYLTQVDLLEYTSNERNMLRNLIYYWVHEYKYWMSNI